MAEAADPRLKTYREKRDFAKTKEPASGEAGGQGLAFVVQKHDATRLHYDFRVEWEGVLKSWAVTRGPSLDPADKRLAVRTEDHPMDYGSFEGTIPKGQYGGGTVMLWDRGTWEPQGDAADGLATGNLKMQLHGEKMRGRWALIRMKPRAKEKRENWLLIKEKDEEAHSGEDILAKNRSAKTGRDMDAIARGDALGDEASSVVDEAAKTAKAPTQTKRSAKPRKAANAATEDDTEIHVAGVRVTHPNRVLFESEHLTKGDLARYYEIAAERMLVHAGGRPLSLMRCPSGPAHQCFFQKHAGEGFPEALGSVEVKEKDGSSASYMSLSNAGSIVAAVQMGGVEFHIWGSRNDKLERPDRLVFDLDPDPSVGFDAVKAAADLMRNALDMLGLKSWPMVTGGKGVHVVAPLNRRRPVYDVGAFAKGLASRVASSDPQRFVSVMSKAERKGKIFIDWLRNERAQTAIAPYSVRSREGAPVAVPVSWDELASLDRANGFTPDQVIRRLKQPDPWARYGDVRQSVTKRVITAVSAED